MTKHYKTTRTVDPSITELASKYEKDHEALLEILKEINLADGYLKNEKVSDVAKALKIPEHHAYGVASFYSMLSLEPIEKKTIRICDGPVCRLHGSAEIEAKINDVLKDHPEWKVERSSCLGLCDRAPAVLVGDKQAGPVNFDHIHTPPSEWIGENPNYSKPRYGELRVMLENTGKIDPESIQSAFEHGAYLGLEKALKIKPSDIIDQVEASGLAGRGGAGFPVGRKWRFVAESKGKQKYIICNADESEPLIFKDRVLMETNPHLILEGMAIAGYATGASEAYIYIRGEYELQAQRLEKAIQQAIEMGWLGERIQDSTFSFHIHVHRGAGAYICGEETALIESLEGKRGEPRIRPPYPPSKGFRNSPTDVNNVESFATIPAILRNGADWYQSLSGKETPGTKLYMVLGHVNNPGLFEAPFDLTLRQFLDQYAGGMRSGSNFKFALTGGAAGTIVPESLLDIPINYQSAAKGVSLGAGAFLFMDQSISVVEFLHQLLYFFKVESCGKCTPCRVGTHRLHQILGEFINKNGKSGDIEEISQLSNYMFESSFCGLGQSVSIPVNSALKHFYSEFNAGLK
jgi:NADP-reducing hydrogenase subunit HndC